MIPNITILQEVDDADWQECERYWIALCKEAGCPLTNTADGGKGATGVMGNRNAVGKRSLAFRKRMAEVAKETRNALGHVVSDETKKGISENLKSYYQNGGQVMCGETNGKSKLTAEQVREIRQRYAEGGISLRKLASEYDVTYGAVHNVILRKSWKHIE